MLIPQDFWLAMGPATLRQSNADAASGKPAVVNHSGKSWGDTGGALRASAPILSLSSQQGTCLILYALVYLADFSIDFDEG